MHMTQYTLYIYWYMYAQALTSEFGIFEGVGGREKSLSVLRVHHKTSVLHQYIGSLLSALPSSTELREKKKVF